MARAAGNLLTADGRLAAVIDFGCCGVGDPACDLTIAWTLFEGESREAFRAALPPDDGAWRRGRGWALWKALITLAALPGANAAKAAKSARIIEAVTGEYRAGNRP
jgi:aminoglycoside phosphotransferase (APT) family kinase protein